jgi:hypothetical protein
VAARSAEGSSSWLTVREEVFTVLSAVKGEQRAYGAMNARQTDLQ